MLHLPREHGAYGQVGFPLLTAWLAVGPSWPAGLFTIAVVAAFFAHEPAAILLGMRGTRVRRDAGSSARRWCVALVASSVLGVVAAWWTMDVAARWSMLLPIIPGVGLAAVFVAGAEKTWFGETLTAVSAAATAAPIAIASGASASIAAVITIPFALLFVATTFAVRSVVLRVRGGGDRVAADGSRNAALVISVAGLLLLALGAQLGRTPASWLVASTPGLIAVIAIAANPPSATRLKQVGWTLIAVSILTSACVLWQITPVL